MRGAVLAKEGKPCDQLIIVVEGEFEQYKSIPVEKAKRPFNPEGNIKRIELPDKRSKIIRIALLGKGSVFGEEDLINNKPYSSSLICSQHKSVVFLLPASEFERVFLEKNEDVLRDVVTMAMVKEKKQEVRCVKFQQLSKMNDDTANK